MNFDIVPMIRLAERYRNIQCFFHAKCPPDGLQTSIYVIMLYFSVSFDFLVKRESLFYKQLNVGEMGRIFR